MDSPINTDIFMSLVKSGEYKKALYLNTEIDPDKLALFILMLSFDRSSFALYTLQIFYLFQRNCAAIHINISEQLSMPFCYLTGAYSAALMHARAALASEPENPAHQRWILTFYRIPEQPLSTEEAKAIAHNFLISNSSDESVLSILRTIYQHDKQNENPPITQKEGFDLFLSLIEQGLYKNARDFLKDFTREQREEHLIECGFKTGSVALYTFICFYLLDGETVATHLFAARFLDEILSKTLPITGAHSAALMHVRRALEIEPGNKDAEKIVQRTEALLFE